jgi:MGT family glycosyltransferase
MQASGHAITMATTRMPTPDLPLAPEVARVASRLPRALRDDGFAVVMLPSSLRLLWHAARIPQATGYDELGHAVGVFTAGIEEHARVLAREAQRARAEVVVGDYLCFSAFFAAKLARLPFIAFYHSALPFPAPGAPPFGSGLAHDAPRDARWDEAQARLDLLLARLDARLARAARALGLPEPEHALLARPYSPVLNLLATLPELEPGLPALEGPVVFTGPCLDARPDERPDDPALAALKDGVRRVYVSLGTVFNTEPRRFASLLGALDRDGVQVIVSAGASYEALRRAPPSQNAHLFRTVPQLALLPRIDAVVTHGGNNTTQETLAAGKPMLVLPFGGDQLENARRVERLGVGLALAPHALDARAVGQAVSRLLDEPRFASRAREVARAIDGVDGVSRAMQAILAVMA